jgi:hypothetical protein
MAIIAYREIFFCRRKKHRLRRFAKEPDRSTVRMTIETILALTRAD